MSGGGTKVTDTTRGFVRPCLSLLNSKVVALATLRLFFLTSLPSNRHFARWLSSSLLTSSWSHQCEPSTCEVEAGIEEEIVNGIRVKHYAT